MLLIRRRRAGREGAGGGGQGVRQRVPAVRRGQGAQRLRTRPGRQQGDSLLGTGHFQFHTKKEVAGGKNSGDEDYIVLVTKIKIKSYSSGVALG